MPISIHSHRALLITLIVAIAIPSRAQHLTAIIPDGMRGASARDVEFVEFEVPPGFSCVSSLYTWVDLPAGTGLEVHTADYYFENGIPVDWIDGNQGFHPFEVESVDCGSPIMISAPITAPMTFGTYEATLVDMGGYYDNVYYTIHVVEEPSEVSGTYQDTLFVDEVGTVIGAAPGSPLDLPCYPAYLPSDAIQYHYAYYPAVPWIEQTPMDLGVLAGEDGEVTATLQSAVAGDFVTYRYRSQSWYSEPQILKIELHVDVATGLEEEDLVKGVERMLFYPNPANEVLNVRMAVPKAASGYFQITDASGREVMRKPRTLNAGENSIAIGTTDLPAGIYGLCWVVPGTGTTMPQRVHVVH